MLSSAVLDLTFAMRIRGTTEANVKSTALGGKFSPPYSRGGFSAATAGAPDVCAA